MGLYDMVPVKTEYNGCEFRSRLEARWAVFFDKMKIQWIYEPECYDLGSYLYKPDFWLVNLNCFGEVKPDTRHFTKDNLEQCKLLSKATCHPLVLLDGLPDFKGYSIITSQGVYQSRWACLTMKKMEGDMNSCLLAISQDEEYKEAVHAARRHRFGQDD